MVLHNKAIDQGAIVWCHKGLIQQKNNSSYHIKIVVSPKNMRCKKYMVK